MNPKGSHLVEQPPRVEASLWRRFRLEGQSLLREALFNRFIALARAVAHGEYRRRPAHGLERGDFEQHAFAGLLEAIDRYDPLRGTPFEAYARPRLKGAISDGLSRSSESGAWFGWRRRLERERVTSLGSAAPAKDDIAALGALAAGLAIGFLAEDARRLEQDTALCAYESLAWRELQLSVLAEIDRLPAQQATVLRQHYLNGLDFTAVAQLMGLSKGRISQLHRSAIERIRERLAS